MKPISFLFLAIPFFSLSSCSGQETLGPSRPERVSVSNPEALHTQELRENAAAGDAESQFQLARTLWETTPLPSSQIEIENYEKMSAESAQFLKLAANKGHVAAQSLLGWYYLEGIGVSKNIQVAEEWLTSSANAGDIFGLHNLATIHMEGITKKPSRMVAKSLFEKSAELGHSGSMHSLGLMANEDEDFPSAVRWYTAAAELGHVEAAHNLGVYSRLGNSAVKQDDRMAFRWFETSANKGYAMSQWALGDMYQLGVGCTQDFVKAIDLYRAAANQGDPNAAFKLGASFAMGVGAPVNEKEALRLFVQAKKNGYDIVYEQSRIQERLLHGEVDDSSRRIIELLNLADRLTPKIAR